MIDLETFDIYKGHDEIAHQLYLLVIYGNINATEKVKAAKAYLKYLKFTDIINDSYMEGVAVERKRNSKDEDYVEVHIEELK